MKESTKEWINYIADYTKKALAGTLGAAAVAALCRLLDVPEPRVTPRYDDYYAKRRDYTTSFSEVLMRPGTARETAIKAVYDQARTASFDRTKIEACRRIESIVEGSTDDHEREYAIRAISELSKGMSFDSNKDAAVSIVTRIAEDIN